MSETDATVVRGDTPVPSHRDEFEARFTPGTVVASRYRIVSLLGEGGMGEVYRADDIRLNQRVALKYVPERLANDPAALERLLHEVKIGRTIAHPNVCRMYDIVEAEGHRFIAMEFVDGEDLASLLRRIGRLPGDKAVAIARDVCAGLAAAHDRGVIHRDLKPANVMIDGRGSARITDFGLAAAADEGANVADMAGTPPYMAPEQLAGSAVTVRSDIYALGLLLYEMFTGKRLFDAPTLHDLRQQHTMAKTRPSSLVGAIDPAVERVILRCLDEDPLQRPSSVHAVLSSLPGGDPLQAAIAAGETPSPQMIAAAGAAGDLPTPRAWALLGAIVVLLIAGAWLADASSVTGILRDTKSRDVLTDRAHNIVRMFGYAAGTDSASWFSSSSSAVLLFHYRESPGPLHVLESLGRVSAEDPPRVDPGDTVLMLDHEGRLRKFSRVPPKISDAPPAAVNWTAAFREAGLDPAAFHDTSPRWTGDVAGDRRYAWTSGPMRVEATSLGGRPIRFEVIEPSAAAAASSAPSPAGAIAFAVIAFVALAATAILAWRNSVRARADLRGALRIAAIAVALFTVGRLLVGHHAWRPDLEYYVFASDLSIGLYNGFFLLLAYIAAEPYVRRRWPRMLIGWSRLVAGRWRDPLIGTEALIGIAGGTAAFVIARTIAAALVGRGLVSPLNPLAAWTGSVAFPLLTALLYQGTFGLIMAFAALSFALLCRLLLRNDFAAFAAAAAGLGLFGVRGALDYTMGLVLGTMTVILLRRVGLIAAAATIMTYNVVSILPLTLRFSEPYATTGIATIVVIAAIAVLAFRISLGGKAMFGAVRLEDEAPA
jgi:serine/threonine-protein kinase